MWLPLGWCSGILWCCRLRFERIDVAEALLLLREPRREPLCVSLVKCKYLSISILFSGKKSLEKEGGGNYEGAFVIILDSVFVCSSVR